MEAQVQTVEVVASPGGRLGYRARILRRRTELLRLFAILLTIYGALVLLTASFGYVLVQEGFDRVREVPLLVGERERTSIALQSVSAALGDASVTTGNLSATFGESYTSLTTASKATAEAADTARTTAGLFGGIELFGRQLLAGEAEPLLGLGDRLG